MYYLTDHITAANGVQALLPAKHNELLGQYKVSVAEKDFQAVRSHMQKYLVAWYDQYVEPDALNAEYQYPEPPMVAPIDAEDYSEDEKSYMTVCFNTAMSMASVLSDETIQDPEIPGAVGGSRRWADVVSDVSPNSRATVGNSPSLSNPLDAALVSAMPSSRAEVNSLREQVAELKAESEMTAQSIAAAAVKQQVVEALTAQFQSQPAERKDHVTNQQFALYIQTQERKFDTLTSMFAQLMANQMGTQAPAPSQSVRIPKYVDDRVLNIQTLGKRTAQDELDQVADFDPMDTGASVDSTRKRIDQQQTPEKASRPSENINSEVPDLAPRRLVSESPCDVPLPASPTARNQQQPSLTPKTSVTSTAAVSHPTTVTTPAQYQQQSMSRYLRIDQTGTSIQDPPPLSCVQISGSQVGNQASLSEAENAPRQPSSSGNESKQQTPRSPQDLEELLEEQS